jgi:hypothetical protein
VGRAGSNPGGIRGAATRPGTGARRPRRPRATDPSTAMPATLLCAGLPTQNSPCEHRPAPMPAQPCPPRPGPGLGHLRGRGRAPLGQPTGTHLPPEPVGGGRRPCPADRGTTCQRFQRPARPGPGGHAGAGRCGGGGPPGPASGVHHAAAGGCTGPLGARGDRDSSCRDVEVLWLPASSGRRWPRAPSRPWSVKGAPSGCWPAPWGCSTRCGPSARGERGGVQRRGRDPAPAMAFISPPSYGRSAIS